MSSFLAQMANGPPYPLPIWPLGGFPTKEVDIPIMSVFGLAYLAGAIAHGVIFYRNEKKGHKFFFSSLMAGFCVARLLMLLLRIGSACDEDNIHLALTVSVFLNAGIALLYVDNLLFALRILRAQHPNFGWRKDVSRVFYFLCTTVVITLGILAIAIIQSYYTSETEKRQMDRKMQLMGATVFFISAALPLFITSATLLVPRIGRLDKFGSGRWMPKIVTLMVASSMLSIAAGWRMGTLWQDPVPRSQDMPAYLDRPALYVGLFVPELIVVFLYAFMRVDQRFATANGACSPGDFRNNIENERAGAISVSSVSPDHAVAEKAGKNIEVDVQSLNSDENSATKGANASSNHVDDVEAQRGDIGIHRFTGLSTLSGKTAGDELEEYNKRGTGVSTLTGRTAVQPCLHI